MLELAALQVEEAQATIGALYLMNERNVDFVDAFLAQTGRARAEGVASFDRDFKKLDVAWLELDPKPGPKRQYRLEMKTS